MKCRHRVKLMDKNYYQNIDRTAIDMGRFGL